MAVGPRKKVRWKRERRQRQRRRGATSRKDRAGGWASVEAGELDGDGSARWGRPLRHWVRHPHCFGRMEAVVRAQQEGTRVPSSTAGHVGTGNHRRRSLVGVREVLQASEAPCT
ncbi:hypothetical protein EJB05_22140, partial [Eragrostis curvula]